MKIAISGSSGLIGSALCKSLRAAGHCVYPIVRSEHSSERSFIHWDPEKKWLEEERLQGLDVVVHLAGENIASKRWSQSQKERILNTRVSGTTLISETLARLEKPPHTLICASAIGFYGDRGDTVLDESAEPGSDFLAQVCKQWEQASQPAADSGIRLIHLRMGMVLSCNGGALKKMLPPFKLGFGGKTGSGKQYISWIALPDLLRIIAYCLENPLLSGAVNAVSPNPVQNNEFAKTLAQLVQRPSCTPFPGFLARIAFGEMADALLLSSTRVKPKRLIESGFEFNYSTLEEALGFLLLSVKK